MPGPTNVYAPATAHTEGSTAMELVFNICTHANVPPDAACVYGIGTSSTYMAYGRVVPDGTRAVPAAEAAPAQSSGQPRQTG
jgi:hypothetical protein